MNPLLSPYNTPYDTCPFDKIKPEHFAPAFEDAFRLARLRIDEIITNYLEPDFENTILALEKSTREIDRIAPILFNLNHAHTSESIQKIALETAPKLSELSNDIHHNQALWARIKKISKNGLNDEQKMLLDKTIKAFIRSGADLDVDKKEEFRNISQELSSLTVQFGENVLAETNSYTLYLTQENDLSGLPAEIIEAAAREADSRQLKGWVFTLQYPSFVPFMKYADKRELRMQMYTAFNTRGLKDNDHDNRALVLKISNLRRKLAKLLGFKDFASYALSNRMAEEPEKVTSFLEQLREAYLPVAKTEVDSVQEFARKTDPQIKIKAWDWSYYSEKLKEALFSISDELTRPYFELNHSEEQVFKLTNRLYGITFKPNKKIPVYHEEVKTYEVIDKDNKILAVLYIDYFPRTNKKPGAWMTGFREQYRENGISVLPHISLVFNFPRPTENKPSLLNHDELRTLLHEFGHALHGIFSDVEYKSLAGTNVYRDFVELPSQIMENWAEQKEWIDEVAIHYKTGEVMPENLVQNIIKSRDFNEAYAGLRQVSFGLLDMHWHSLQEEYKGEIPDFEEDAMQSVSILPRVKDTAMSTSFSHIFTGGYAAGYYGYKWAEVMDADAFSKFRKNGLFSREVAEEFRQKILAKGGSKHPMQLYIDFMGREPGIEALLQRSGSSKN